jgi:hypothetical protein
MYIPPSTLITLKQNTQWTILLSCLNTRVEFPASE